MNRQRWLAASLGLAFALAAPAASAQQPRPAAPAASPVAAAAPAAAADAGSSQQCVPKQASDALAICPGGITKFTPKDSKPAGVKIGAVSPQQQGQKGLKPGGPSVGVEVTRELRGIQIKGRVRQLLATEIAQLEQLFRVTARGAADRAQLARRLAETYVELENAALRDKFQAEEKKDTAGAASATKLIGSARANAIRYYTLLANEYKTYPQLDEVLYFLAYEYEQANKLEDARRVYYQLINEAPKSRFIPNAYLAFGELFFFEAQTDPKQYEVAKQSYQKVLEYPPPENKVWGYAQYKLGYVYWNSGERELPRALEAFKKVIEFGNQYGSLPGVAALQNSARKDIVPVYTMVGKPESAYAFFRPLSGDGGGDSTKTYKMMDELGLNYIDTGHYPDAITLYEDLLRRDKGDNTCQYQSRIVQATMAMKGGQNKQAVVTRLEDQVKAYREFKANPGRSEASKQACANVTAELVTETGMSWHLEAVGSGTRGTSDKKTMEYAARLYRLVVDAFSKEEFARFEFPRIVKEDWPTLYTIKYAMADLLYFQGDWEKCGPAFDLVVDENPTGPEAPEAAYASVLCYQKLYDQQHAGRSDRRGSGNLPGQRDRPGATARESLARKEMTPAQKGMLQAFNRYVCYIKPSENDAKAKEQYVEVKYARARTYFESHQWEEAAAGFRDIALNHSDTDAGIYAAQLYLETLNVMGSNVEPRKPSCIDEMADALPKIVTAYCDGAKASRNADQCTTLGKIQCDIQRLKAENTVKTAQQGGPGALRLYEEGANLYLALWRRYGEGVITGGSAPQCDRMEEIVFNAAEAYQSAHLVLKSINTRLILLDAKYKMDKTELAKKSTYKIGGNYQAIAAYEQAAEWYERYAKTFPDGDKADQALSDAVVLRLGLGQEKEAIDDADLFTKKFSAKFPTQAAQVGFAIGAHYAEREDWGLAARRLQGSMGLIDRSGTPDVKAQAHALLGRAYLRTKHENQAGGEYKRVQGIWADPKGTAEKIIKDDPEGGPRKVGRALTAVGEAYFFFAEREKKKVDAINFPKYEGPADKASVLKHIQVKVKGWLQKKRPAIEAAEKEYLKIVKLEPEPPPRWVIAAGSRVGGMWGEFVREFRAAPIPAAIKRDDELRTTYYNALDEASEPQKQRAKAAYETCLKYSVTYQYFDEFSRACEVWLSKTYKNEYHQVDEFRAVPNRVNSGLSDRPYPLLLDGSPFNPNPASEPEKGEAVEAQKPSDKPEKPEKPAKGQKAARKPRR
ncbi:MAG: tetratricopeptide repeat protein [Polyangiaceae bacterium]|nr:tetratricopeptide repeat protein [Polyangiaceae bacterium]